MAKRILFIDRDGTLIIEPSSGNIDGWDKLQFYPHVFKYMNLIATGFDYELVMVSNQDGLGTTYFPYADFQPIHDFIIKAFENEDVRFSAVYIDGSFKEDKSPNRKPRIGMVKQYMNNPDYDLGNSFVIGDRITDVQFAKNGVSAKALGTYVSYLDADKVNVAYAKNIGSGMYGAYL